MRGFLQRLREIRVEVGEQVISAIGYGFLIFSCAMEGDSQSGAAILAQKPAKLPILRDKIGKMNRFRVTLGRESDFEEVWLSRDSYLKGVPVAGAPNIPLAPPVTSPSA